MRRFRTDVRDAWSWEPYCVGLDRIDHRERVLVFTSFFEQIEPLRRHLTGALAGLRSLSTAAILRLLWVEHLALAPALQERVDGFRRAHFGGATLGVHVRDSDRRTRVAAIEATTARLVGRHPHLRIFLASDNAEVLRRYAARFGDVIATEKWYPPPGESMHEHAARPDPTAGAADALVDMHLLAACDRLNRRQPIVVRAPRGPARSSRGATGDRPPPGPFRAAGAAPLAAALRQLHQAPVARQGALTVDAPAALRVQGV